MATSVSYQLGTRSAVELTQDIEDFWPEWRRNTDLQARTARIEITPDELEKLSRRGTYDLHEEGAGLDHTAVSLIVAFAPAVNHAAMTFWDTVLLPWIRERWGDDAVGLKKP